MANELFVLGLVRPGLVNPCSSFSNHLISYQILIRYATQRRHICIKKQYLTPHEGNILEDKKEMPGSYIKYDTHGGHKILTCPAVLCQTSRVILNPLIHRYPF